MGKVYLKPEGPGIEIKTEERGISGRLWLDLDEACVVRNWLNENLAELRRKDALSQAASRDAKIAELEKQLEELRKG